MNDIWKLRQSPRADEVALPRKLMQGDSVRVRRQGKGLLIEPVETDMSWIDALEPLDDDAAAAAVEGIPAGLFYAETLGPLNEGADIHPFQTSKAPC